MFGNSGAFSLLEAPFVSIEESGSDNVPTLFMRFPRRTQLPAPQKCSSVKWGSGGTWLLKDQGASRRSFSKATSPGDFLVPFASLQKELAAAAAKPLFRFFRGCSACGRATFQRRKVAKVLRACGPGPRRVALFRRQSRPARCHQEGCLTVIATALLNRRDRYFYKMICA